MDDVTKCANNIFEQPWWLNTVAKNRWQDITIVENNEVIARWPVVSKKRFLFQRITMPKLTQTLGIWIKPAESAEPDTLSRLKEITIDLLGKIPHAHDFKVRLDSSFNYFLPFHWRGYSIKPLITYKITDLKNPDDIFSNFDKSTKRKINSAKKKLVIREDLDIDVLIRVVNLTYQAQNRKSPISVDLIKSIDEACKRNGTGKMLAAVDDAGNVHACTYFVFDENTFYYLIPGSDPQYKSSNAQSLIIWEAIKIASSLSREFDFEGSMIEGIEKFFRQFGAKPVVYYQISKIPFIFEIFELLKPKIKKIIHYR